MKLRKSKSTETFAEKVRDVVRKIPSGKTLSYTEVARRAGSPKAARAVGNILHNNYDPKIPCHRVIRSDGTLGGYNRGAGRKKAILLAEEKVKKAKLKNNSVL